MKYAKFSEIASVYDRFNNLSVSVDVASKSVKRNILLINVLPVPLLANTPSFSEPQVSILFNLGIDKLGYCDIVLMCLC